MSYVITATNLGIEKKGARSESNSSSSSGRSQFDIISNTNIVNISKSSVDDSKTTVEAAEAACGVHAIKQRPMSTPTAVCNSTKPAATLV